MYSNKLVKDLENSALVPWERITPLASLVCGKAGSLGAQAAVAQAREHNLAAVHIWQSTVQYLC